MKVIDLLNKIAKDEEIPKKIIIRGNEFIFGGINSIENYYLTDKGDKWLYCIDIRLNDEIEIIEEEKDIEEIGLDEDEFMDVNFKKIEKIINELVREVNKIKHK